MSSIKMDEILAECEAQVPEKFNARLRFAKCPHCGRRPGIVALGPGIRVASGVEGVPAALVLRHETLPCCSTRYVKENEGLSAKQTRALETRRLI